MVNREIKMQRLDDGKYVVTVDGANIEAPTLGAALDILRRETGDTASSAKWEAMEHVIKELKLCNKDLSQKLEDMTADRDKYKTWWYKLYCENARMRDAICAAYIKEYCA